MALSASEIRSVIKEVKPLLLGGRIQRVIQASHEAFTFSIRNKGLSRLLHISTSHQFSRIHLTSQQVKSDESPLPFYMFLRKNCEGGVVRDIRQVGDDRIVEIEIEKKEAPPLKSAEQDARRTQTLILIAELFGRTSNLICVDAERTIMESLRHASGASRVIRPKEKYTPPKSNRADEAKGAAKSSKLVVQNRFEPAGSSRPQGDDSSDASLRSSADLGSVSFRIERHYLQSEARARALQLRSALETALRRAKKEQTKRIENIEKELREASKAQELRVKGELLKANMTQIRPGMKSIRVTDFFDPGQREVDIELDAALSPKDNLARYFKRYKKLVAGQQEMEKRLHDARAALDKVQEFSARLSDLASQRPDADGNDADLSSDVSDGRQLCRIQSWLNEHKRLYDEIAEAGLMKAVLAAPRKRGDKETASSEPRRFVSADGAQILVGRNNRQNDELTIRLARGNDLWLHVQHVPGSHVVVRSQRGKSVSLETLLDAANLAVFFSKARDASRPLVDYTHCKYVRKPKGAKPGVVTFSQNKTLVITPDRDRLERLFATA